MQLLCIHVAPDHPDCLKSSCGENFYCNGVSDEGTPACRCVSGYELLGQEDDRRCEGVYFLMT